MIPYHDTTMMIMLPWWSCYHDDHATMMTMIPWWSWYMVMTKPHDNTMIHPMILWLFHDTMTIQWYHDDHDDYDTTMIHPMILIYSPWYHDTLMTLLILPQYPTILPFHSTPILPPHYSQYVRCTHMSSFVSRISFIASLTPVTLVSNLVNCLLKLSIFSSSALSIFPSILLSTAAALGDSWLYCSRSMLQTERRTASRARSS